MKISSLRFYGSCGKGQSDSYIEQKLKGSTAFIPPDPFVELVSYSLKKPIDASNRVAQLVEEMIQNIEAKRGGWNPVYIYDSPEFGLKLDFAT